MTAKKRLIKYLKIKGVSQYDFSKRTGLSNGYLNSGDNVTSANLDVITNIFSDLNLLWVVKGIGPMIIPSEVKQLTYTINDGENLDNILNEDYLSWISDDWEEKLLNMSAEDLIKFNKLFRIILRSKDETIQAKDDQIVTLEQLLVEKENLSKIKDQLIAQIQQNQPKGDS